MKEFKLSEKIIRKMNEGKDTSLLLVESIEIIQELEKSLKLLDSTERNRIILLKENIELKKKLGEFVVVDKLMKSAGVYGYLDLLKDNYIESEKLAGDDLK